MKENSKKLVETGIIGVCVVVLLLKFLMPKPAQNIRQPLRGGAAAELDIDKAKKTLSDTRADKVQPADSGRPSIRDIFQKPNELLLLEEAERRKTYEKKDGVTPEQDLTLEGIVWGGPKNTAIISGTVVFEGDMVKGVKVLKIGQDGVTILKNGLEVELKR